MDGGQTLPGAGDMSLDGNGRQGSIINRITSRLSRRYVGVLSTGIDIVGTLLYSVRVAALGSGVCSNDTAADDRQLVCR